MAPAALRVPNLELIGVASRREGEARRCAEYFGFRRSYSDYRHALDDPAVDVVYLATPNELHAAQAIQAIGAGKHVLVEKPLALSEADARDVVTASRRAGVRLSVGFHLRYHRAHRDARQIIHNGILGRALAADFRFARPPMAAVHRSPDTEEANVLTRRAVHLVDLALYLLERKPRRLVTCMNADAPAPFGTASAFTLLELEGGTFVTLTASPGFAYSKDRQTLFGTAGSIELVQTCSTDERGVLDLRTTAVNKRVEYTEPDLYRREIQAFNARVLHNSDDDRSLSDAVLGVSVLAAMLRSAKTCSSIELPNLALSDID
jgi:predicted dehydrogenase